jgi:hypothetical protein
MMDSLITIIGIWVVISIPASLIIARFLSATNPEAKTHRAPLIPFRLALAAFEHGKEKLFSRHPMHDETHPSKNVSS